MGTIARSILHWPDRERDWQSSRAEHSHNNIEVFRTSRQGYQSSTDPTQDNQTICKRDWGANMQKLSLWLSYMDKISCYSDQFSTKFVLNQFPTEHLENIPQFGMFPQFVWCWCCFHSRDSRLYEKVVCCVCKVRINFDLDLFWLILFDLVMFVDWGFCQSVTSV